MEEHKFEYQHNGYTVRHEPIGVCGLISVELAHQSNCFKVGTVFGLGLYASKTQNCPLSANLIAEIIHKAGAPAGVFNMVHGMGPVVGEAMSSHPDIDMMSFTGSTRGGIAVAQASAKTVKGLVKGFEKGKSPNIILDDEVFAKSITDGVNSTMSNTGQANHVMHLPERYDGILNINNGKRWWSNHGIIMERHRVET